MITYNEVANREDRLFHQRIKKALVARLGIERGMSKYNQLATVAKIEFNKGQLETVNEIQRNNVSKRLANLVFVRELKKLGIKLNDQQ